MEHCRRLHPGSGLDAAVAYADRRADELLEKCGSARRLLYRVASQGVMDQVHGWAYSWLHTVQSYALGPCADCDLEFYEAGRGCRQKRLARPVFCHGGPVSC